MFAWAVDGAGRFQLYDNPPGSLQLLAFYGFCSYTCLLYTSSEVVTLIAEGHAVEDIIHGLNPVSYTHLDVYKRQLLSKTPPKSRKSSI